MGFSPDFVLMGLVLMGLLWPNYGVAATKAILGKHPPRHG
jgi:hypothetical protein